MSECKHENADHLMPGDRFQPYGEYPRSRIGAMESVLVEQFRCVDCGAWLPLGPARDDGEFAEAVAVEVRAAEIAAALETGDGCAVSSLEIRGFNDKWPQLRGGAHVLLDTSAQRAGYLAHAITTHTEQREDER